MDLDNVTYKKGDKLRYFLWVVCIAVIISVSVFIVKIINNKDDLNVPSDYKFSLVDDFSSDILKTTYYVYDDDKIIVEVERYDGNEEYHSLQVYDINTKDFEYDENDLIEVCNLGVCNKRPRVLLNISRLVSKKTGRDYVKI